MTRDPQSAAQGFVYCLINPSMPGLIKIGVSTNNPLERARQLSASTSSPAPFVVAFYRHISYPFAAEAAIHSALDDYRINESREFFKIPLHKAIEEIERFDEVPESRGISTHIDLPFSELFATFGDDGSGRELTEEEQIKCRDLERKLRR